MLFEPLKQNPLSIGSNDATTEAAVRVRILTDEINQIMLDAG